MTWMGTVPTVANWLGYAGAAAWAYLLAFRGGFWLVREQPCPALTKAAKVVAVIPARDEEAVVGETIRSLLTQQFPGDLSVVLVDDNSSDGTADAARRAALQTNASDRLQIITGSELPPGWTGKLWAVSQGVAIATQDSPDFLLFTDADIVHHATNVAELVARSERDRLDLASLMVKLQCRTLPEKALIPAFVFFFFMLYPPKWIADSGNSTAGAAGGCVLIRPAALRRIGGIATIRNALIDDCTLAKAVKDTGGKLWLGVTQKTQSNRDYETFSEIGRMISRTAYTQLRYSPLLLLGSLLGMFVTYIAPLLFLLLGSGTNRIIGALICSAMALAFLPVVLFYRRSPFWALTLPFVALFYMGATLNSACRYWQGEGGSWKGRSQALGQ